MRFVIEHKRTVVFVENRSYFVMGFAFRLKNRLFVEERGKHGIADSFFAMCYTTFRMF